MQEFLAPLRYRFLRRALTAGCALAIVLLVLTGCQSHAERGTLVVGMSPVPLTFDPHHHNDNVTWSLLSNFYDGLVRFSEEMELQPDLAESWKQVDPTHLVFTLRLGARFASGQPLRAADVVASFDRAVTDPRSRVRHYLLGIRDVHALDEHRVVVVTQRPSPTLLNRLVYLFIVPASDAGRPEITIPNGTGPYRVEQLVRGHSLTAVAWPSFRGLPQIHRVRFVFQEDTAALTRRFLNGQLDVVRGLEDESLPEVRADSALRAEPQPQLAVLLLAINPHAARGDAARALADPRVRRAMLMACDRGRIIREAYRGLGAVATQYVHPAVFGYDPAIEPVRFDPTAAKSLLVEAGFPDGFDVPLECAVGQEDLLPPLVDGLAEAGIRLRPHQVAWSELIRTARAGQGALVLRSWACSTGDTSDFLEACVHTRSEDEGVGMQNYSDFSDPALDALIEAADRELNPVRRLKMLQNAQRKTLEELPILPLVVRFGYMGASNRVEIVTRFDQWQWVAAYHWRLQ